jgi:hypothetical protein
MVRRVDKMTREVRGGLQQRRTIADEQFMQG